MLGTYMKYILLTFIALLLNSCSHLNTDVKFNDKSLIGKDISHAIKHLKIKFDSSFVINEPPGVPRGVYGKDKYGYQVYLFIKRGDILFRKRFDYKLEEFYNKKIIGIFRDRGKFQDTYGEVLFY